MDSDDLLEEDAMEICYLKCEEMQLDFVFFDAQSFNDNNVKNAPSLNYKRTDKLENKVYVGNEALELLIFSTISRLPSVDPSLIMMISSSFRLCCVMLSIASRTYFSVL